MDSQTKISDFSSDASTEIIPDNTSQETDIKIHNKIDNKRQYLDRTRIKRNCYTAWEYSVFIFICQTLA